MKKSFKLIILLLAFTMLFALASCGSDGGDSGTSSSSGNNTEGSSTQSNTTNNSANDGEANNGGNNQGAGNGGDNGANDDADDTTNGSTGDDNGQNPGTPPVIEGTEGFVFELDTEKNMYKIVSYEGTDTVVTVPTWHDGKRVYKLESMGPFDSAKNITSLTVPNGVEAIGLKALESCINMESLTVPFVGGGKYILENDYTDKDWGLRMSYILSDGKDVLGNPIALKLKKITITGGTELGSSAFWGLDTVTSITLPNTITTIGDEAFGNCSSLKEMHLPASVTSMGVKIFSGCSSLEKITVPFLGTKEYTLNGESGDRFPLGELFMTYGMDEERNLGLGANSPFYAVFQARGTATVDEICIGKWYPVPKTLTSVTVLRGEVCPSAFRGMSHLTEVILEDGVVSLGNYALDGCTSLEKISIPNSMSYLGAYSIMNMYNELYSSCLDYENYNGLMYINNWLLKIIDTESSSLKLKPSTIGITSFFECNNTEIFIPKSVKFINAGAFGPYNHQLCIYVEAESSVTTWQYDWNVWGLYTFYGATDKYGVTEDGIKWCLISNGELIVTGCTIQDGSIVAIPSKIDGNAVTTITTGAFGDGRSNVSGVVIPESVIYAHYSSICDVTLFFEGNSIPSTWEYDAISGCSIIYNYGGEHGTEGDFAWVKSKNGTITITAYIGDPLVEELVVPSTIGGYPVSNISKSILKSCYYINKLTIPFIGESSTYNNNSFVSFIFGGDSYHANQNLPLTELTVTGGEYIGANALTYIDSIEKLSIPFIGEYSNGAGVNHIGHLWGATELSNNGSYLPESLKSLTVSNASIIYRYALNGASNLTEIILADGLETIQEYALHSCSSIKELTIPTTVTYMGNGALYNCKALISLSIPFVGEKADGTGLTHLSHIFAGASYIPAIKTIALTNTERIPERAFDGCSSINTIVLPKNLTSIEDNAFNSCSGIVEIINHSSLNITAGSNDFGGIAKNAVLIHEGESALIIFDGFIFCPGDEEYVLIGATLDKSIKELYLPYSYNNMPYSIKDNAFMGYSSVETIVIEGWVTRIGFGAFCDCVNITSITLPFIGSSHDAPAGEDYFGYIFGDPSNTYAQENEYLRTKLTTVSIPYAVKIPAYAFYYNRYIQTINISNEVTTIGAYAFAYCSSLTSFSVPHYLKSIGESAFALGYNNSFSDLYIKNLAGWCALELTDAVSSPMNFAKNIYINGILTTEIIIPDDVEIINDYTFAYANAITKITLPAYLTKIGSMAFYYCRSITEINIPRYVESIGEYAFFNCTGLETVDFSENISLKTIGGYAFARCSKISYIYLPDSLEQIEEYAFENCSGITEMNLPFVGGLKNPESDEERYTFGYIFGAVAPTSTTTPTGFAKVRQSFNGQSKSYYIPLSLTKLTIRSGEIPTNGVSNCSMLTCIILGDEVTKIGPSAFYYCTGLTEIDLGSATELWGASLAECTSLKKITLPATLIRATGAFYGLTSLETIEIASGNSTFVMKDNCLIDTSTGTLITAFPGFIIPNDGSIKCIGSYAFYRMNNMPSLIIPDSVTTIGYSAFSECKGSSTITITIGANVTEIEYGAFSRCTNVTISVGHKSPPAGWDPSWYSKGTNTSVLWKS